MKSDLWIETFYATLKSGVHKKFEPVRLFIFSNAMDELRNVLIGTEYYPLYLYRLNLCYKDTFLCPQPDLLQRFKDLGLDEEDLKWFTSVEDMIDKLMEIHKNNRLILDHPGIVYLFINYLQRKIESSLLKSDHYTVKHGKTEMTFLQNELDKFRKRKASITGVPESGKYQEIDRAMLDLLNDDKIEGVDLKTLYQDISVGNINDFYFKDFYPNRVDKASTRVTDGQVYRELYYLFRLITKDEKLIMPREYDKDYNGYQNFSRYQVAHIKAIIKPRNLSIK